MCSGILIGQRPVRTLTIAARKTLLGASVSVGVLRFKLRRDLAIVQERVVDQRLLNLRRFINLPLKDNGYLVFRLCSF